MLKHVALSVSFYFRLYLSRFNLSHHSFCQPIHTVRVVLLVEAGTEQRGESLVEAGTDRAEEGLDEVIGRGVALTIHQFDAELALCIGEFLHARSVSLLDVLLH